MLGTAYLDDSADAAHATVFLAAGFFGPDGGGEWKRLRREWRKILKLHKIPYYRTYDWRTLTGSFEGLKNKWGQDRARRIADDIRKKLEAVIENGPVLAGGSGRHARSTKQSTVDARMPRLPNFRLQAYLLQFDVYDDYRS